MLRLSAGTIRRPLTVLTRLHSHSHGHGHSHGPNSYLQTANLKDAGVRVTWLGLLTNLGMAAGKGVGGVVFHSQSLIADAIHAVSDLLSDFLTLATVSVAKKPTSRYFPNGYGRIETMGAAGVSVLLVFAGVSTGYSSILTISEYLLGESSAFVHYLSLLPVGGHHHGPLQMAEWNAMWIALASIGIKEALYQVTYRVGKKKNSQVLMANAWHHRVDCLASAVSVLSISGGRLFGLTWLDPLGGLVISIMIIRAGIPPLKQAIFELAGSTKEAAKSSTCERFTDEASALVGKMLADWNLDRVELEQYGSNYMARVFIKPKTPGETSLDPEAAARLREELKTVELIKQVYITIC